MPVTIDVCVCTFRRESLSTCLRSVARQDVGLDRTVRVIVADNDDRATLGGAMAALSHELDVPIAYIHAPARNISIARNACLDAATGDWVVFIDDDEEAPADWLDRLLTQAAGADVIFGTSRAIMPDEAPGWMRSGVFHSNSLTGNDQLHNGYTCNVAMRRSAVAGLRFSVPLGTSGGEDTLFFEEAVRAGLRFAYQPDAEVTEPIPANRATLRWLLRRRFRSGQTHALLLARRGQGAARIAPLALAKAGASFLALPLTIGSAEKAARTVARGWFHLGVVAAALGKADLQEYGSPPSVRDAAS
jgi:succinoglycan biosynthesis protein ExoM